MAKYMCSRHICYYIPSNQTKRGMTLGIMAMSLLRSLAAVLMMIAMASAHDEAVLLAFKA